MAWLQAIELLFSGVSACLLHEKDLIQLLHAVDNSTYGVKVSGHISQSMSS
jgi:hypothetical protein